MQISVYIYAPTFSTRWPKYTWYPAHGRKYQHDWNKRALAGLFSFTFTPRSLHGMVLSLCEKCQRLFFFLSNMVNMSIKQFNKVSENQAFYNDHKTYPHTVSNQITNNLAMWIFVNRLQRLKSRENRLKVTLGMRQFLHDLSHKSGTMAWELTEAITQFGQN